MASFSRSIKRKKDVHRKKTLRKNLKSALRATAGMPTKCSACGAPFDKDSDPSKWFMNVGKLSIKLLCPSCVNDDN
tara:strand:+ start:158 stop:385 length:228 start_codon:yes stop_codon:yes gene_type:complete